MKGFVRIRTELGDDGRTRIVELAASNAFAAKITAPGQVHLVGAAATPMDGDHVTIDLHVGRGTRLRVGTVAATLAWPSRRPAPPSLMELRAWVGAGAALEWLPEPIVPVRGCRHRLVTEIDLDRAAQLLWREELVLGRAHEGPGEIDLHTRVERGGAPLLHQHLAIDGEGGGDRHRRPAVLGGARATGTVLAVGPGAPEHTATLLEPGLHGAVLELEGGGRLATASSGSAARLARWLDERQSGLTAAGTWPHPPPTTVPVPEVLTS